MSKIICLRNYAALIFQEYFFGYLEIYNPDMQSFPEIEILIFSYFLWLTELSTKESVLPYWTWDFPFACWISCISIITMQYILISISTIKTNVSYFLHDFKGLCVISTSFNQQILTEESDGKMEIILTFLSYLFQLGSYQLM